MRKVEINIVLKYLIFIFLRGLGFGVCGKG